MTQTGAPGRMLKVKRMELRFVLKEFCHSLVIVATPYNIQTTFILSIRFSLPCPLYEVLFISCMFICDFFYPRLKRMRSSNRTPPGCRTVCCRSLPAQICWSSLESKKPLFSPVHTHAVLFCCDIIFIRGGLFITC